MAPSKLTLRSWIGWIAPVGLCLALEIPARAGELWELDPGRWLKKMKRVLVPGPPCEPVRNTASAELLAPEAHPVVLGARRALGIFYQDCDATRLVWDDQSDAAREGLTPIASVYLADRKANLRHLPADKVESYVDWHYALRSLRARSKEEPPTFPKPSCEDVTRIKPPVYGYGSKCPSSKDADGRQVLSLRTDRNSIKDGHWDGIDEKSGASVAAIDCSGLVAFALAAGGAKLDSRQSSAEMVIGTMTLPQHAKSASGCIKTAKMEFPLGLQPGDILNMPAHHVVMVDSVGPDPLGIQKAVDAGNCDSISRDSFDFTLIHSGSAGDLGPARVSARFKTSPNATAGVMGSGIENNLISMARKVCSRKLAGVGEGLVASQVGSANGLVFSVYRHQSDRPECLMSAAERPRLEGEQCLDADQCDLGFQ